MRPGIHHLLQILRKRADHLSLTPSAFAQVLDLAEREHLVPWVAHLCSAHASPPAELFRKLNAIHREAAIAAFYWTAELTRLLQAFAQASLPVVPLKGPFLAERLYGNPALRVCYDLDLLVAPRDLPAAETVLSTLGFRPGAPDDYHRQWYRGPTTVELHHDVQNPLAFHFDTPAVLARTLPATFLGQPCRRLAPSDELLFLCLHAVRHRFERLSLIVDLCHAFRKLPPPPLDVRSPHGRERAGVLLLGLAMARRLDPTLNPLTPLHSSLAQQKHVEALAGRLWFELLSQPSNVLDLRTLHAFYLELELPRHRLRRRIRHLRILAGRIIQPDVEFAARFGLHRTWQVRLLRPFRLLSATLLHAPHPHPEPRAK